MTKQDRSRQVFKPKIEAPRWNLELENERIQRWEEESTYQFNKNSKMTGLHPTYRVECTGFKRHTMPK